MNLDNFIRDHKTGKIAIWQAPNPAIWVFVMAYAARWFTDGRLDHRLAYVGRGALIVWGLDELVRGNAPIRRALGLVVLAWELWQVFSS